MNIDLRRRADRQAVIDRSNVQERVIRAKLSCKTVKELREFARANHISLAGASSKQGIISEIMTQYGHQWGPRRKQ